MKTSLFIFIVLLSIGCTRNKNHEGSFKQEYPDKGLLNLNDTIYFSPIPDSAIIHELSNISGQCLQHINYRPDQFSCVVEGWGYFGLKNICTRTIRGNVRRSWMYNDRVITEDIPYTLAQGELQTFKCFYVTKTQPVDFDVSAYYSLDAESFKSFFLNVEDLFIPIKNLSFKDKNKSNNEVSTISNGLDNGSCNTIACSFPKSMRHGSNEECVNNIIYLCNSIPNVSTVNIGGHGSPGYMEVGGGQSEITNIAFPNGKFIDFWVGVRDWEPIFSKLTKGQFSEIVIWSCNVGAKPEGAWLLKRLADATNKKIKAGTGILLCTRHPNGDCTIAYETGTQYQVAYPNQNPPSPLPMPQKNDLFNKSKTYFIKTTDNNGNRKEFSLSEIVDINITRVDRYSKKSNSVKITSQKLKETNMTPIFSDPFIMSNTEVLGVVTKSIYINFLGFRKSYLVYNDRVVKEEGTDWFYYINPVFIELLD